MLFHHTSSVPTRAEVPFFSRMWVRLVLGSLALVIVAISFTAGFIVRFDAGELRENVMQRNEQIARRAAEEIGAFIVDARRDLTQTADNLLLLRRMPWVSDVLLQNEVMSSGIFERVVLLDRNGDTRADSDLGPSDLSVFPAEAVGKAREGASWMSPVSIDIHGLPGLTFVVPAGRNAALLARLSLERIWRLIDDIDAGPGGSAYVVSADGILVASPDKSAVLRRERPPVPARPIARNNLLVGSTVTGLGWTVYIQQPIANAFFAVDLVLRRSLFLGLIGLAMALFLGVVVARLYVRPLDALLRGTVRIAEGDLSYRIHAPRRDEFGVLSRAFNDMVGRLAERTAALEESERRYRHITEGVGDIIYSIDGQGRFSFLNSRVQKVLGRDPSEMVGRQVTEFVASLHRAQKSGDLKRTLSAGMASESSGEAVAMTPDGREVVLEYESIPTVSPTGEAQVHGIARDVTQRRLLEERLRRSEKLAALGEIVSRVAHELRGAVAGIAASMTLVRERGRVDGEREAVLDRALSEAVRAQGIVQTLLGSSPPGASRRERCSVIEAVFSVIALRKDTLDAAGIALSVEVPPRLPSVIADPDQLRQVFHNILDNAEHALRVLDPAARGREIRVRAWTENGRVRVETADSGPGIAAEHFGRIFDPFYTTRVESGGSGLGLAVSLGITEAIGGDISARSAPGEGAAFIVDLPAVPESGQDAPSEDDGGLAGLRVLVVEDEPSIREFVRRFMESHGCAVDSACNGLEGVARLANGSSYDLVISDFKMPDRDGRDLYEWIRGSRPSLLRRLIYLTGDSMNFETRAFLAQTGVSYLLKPVEASLLAAEVRRTLASATRNPG